MYFTILFTNDNLRTAGIAIIKKYKDDDWSLVRYADENKGVNYCRAYLLGPNGFNRLDIGGPVNVEDVITFLKMNPGLTA